ncbi:MAG: nitroreductase family protein [Ignavibacteria bacterium]|nr:nitroreductase family protein [Ignavibacteria bacterium]
MSNFIKLEFKPYSEEQILTNSSAFLELMNRRRTVRDFSAKSVSREVIENIIMTASTAPSGAHKQPWTFCVVSDPVLKKEIRKAAEKEEYENYHGRMDKQWIEDLAYLGTDWHKPFLETAPYLIIVFKKLYDITEKGGKKQNYYVNESVGIACGFLLTAIHNAGLCALTHTPSPMGFLSKILKRPVNERPYLLIPLGYPAENCEVPELKRKSDKQVITFY